MEMNKMVGMIIAVTVSIILFISVLYPITSTANTGDSTWNILIGVCGTLAIIAILMMVVRNLSSKN